MESLLSLLLLGLAVLMVSSMTAAVMRMNRQTHENRAALNAALAAIDAGALPQDALLAPAQLTLRITLEDTTLGTKEQLEEMLLPAVFDFSGNLVADIRPDGQ